MLFLLSDPERVIPADLERRIRAAGHQVRRDPETGALDGGANTVLLLAETPDLITRLNRARDLSGEVLIMTVRTGRDSRATAEVLNRGADDDLVLPVPPRELIARAEAARRTHARDRRDAQVSLGVTVFEDDRVPEVSGRPLPLSALEGRLLSRLLRHAGRTVTREALYQALYAYAEQAPSERVVDVHVCHLRRKLREALGDAAPRIRTVRGVGYVAGPA